MEYRKLPHGKEYEKFGVLGLGMGGIQHTPAEEIEAIFVRQSIMELIFLIFVPVVQCMNHLPEQ